MRLLRRLGLFAAYGVAEGANYNIYTTRKAELNEGAPRSLPDDFPRADFARWFAGEVTKEEDAGRLVSQVMLAPAARTGARET